MCTCHGLEHNVRLAKQHLNDASKEMEPSSILYINLARLKMIDYTEDILVLLPGMFGHFLSFAQIALTIHDAA